MTSIILYLAIAISSFGAVDSSADSTQPPSNNNETYVDRLKTSDKHQ